MKILSLLLINLLLISCSSSNASNQESKQAALQETQNNQMMKKNVTETKNCFDEINIELNESILVYWAEISTDETLLANHAGNLRFVITQDGTLHYSYNDGGIESLDNYFNTELKEFKKLSTEALEKLKTSFEAMQIGTLPDYVERKDVHVSSGTIKYLYSRIEGSEACVKFSPSAALPNEIKKLFRALQA